MIGTMKHINNKDKHSNLESDEYYRVIVFSGGEYSNLLLTASDLLKYKEREAKNPEDCVKPSWWQRFLHWFMR